MQKAGMGEKAAAICQHEEDVLLLLLLRGKADAKLSPGEVPSFLALWKVNRVIQSPAVTAAET